MIVAVWKHIVVRKFDDALDGLMVKYLSLYMRNHKDVKESLWYEDDLAAAGLMGTRDRDSESDSDSTQSDSDTEKVQRSKKQPGKRGFRIFDIDGADLPRGRRLVKERMREKN